MWTSSLPRWRTWQNNIPSCTSQSRQGPGSSSRFYACMVNDFWFGGRLAEDFPKTFHRPKGCFHFSRHTKQQLSDQVKTKELYECGITVAITYSAGEICLNDQITQGVYINIRHTHADIDKLFTAHAYIHVLKLAYFSATKMHGISRIQKQCHKEICIKFPRNLHVKMHGNLTFVLKPLLSESSGILVETWKMTSVVELQ